MKPGDVLAVILAAPVVVLAGAVFAVLTLSFFALALLIQISIGIVSYPEEARLRKRLKARHRFFAPSGRG